MSVGFDKAAVKRRVFEVLEVATVGDRAARIVGRLIVALIVVNVAAVVLETVPDMAAARENMFVAVELVTVVLFSIEYALRVWVANLHGPLRQFGTVGARLRYMVQPTAVIDLLSILPTWAGFLLGLADMNVLVVFRLLRFLKLARYSAGMASLMNAVASERRALMASGVVMGGLIVTAATLMYQIEGRVQPDKLGSIPLAMYWAVTSLTTVGYGDVVPVTGAGKLLASVVMLFGFCMFALPVGIVATAFVREIHSRDFVVTWGMVSRVPLFADLKASEVAEVARLLSAQSIEAGAVITSAGEPAHSMYFISAGSVEIDLRGRKIRLDDGAFFGEVAVLRRATRSADAIALTRCRLLLLDAEDLHRLMARKPELAKHIRRVARERIGHDVVTPTGDLVGSEIGLDGLGLADIGGTPAETN